MQQLHVLEADNQEMKGLSNENKEAFKDALVTNEQLQLRVTVMEMTLQLVLETTTFTLPYNWASPCAHTGLSTPLTHTTTTPWTLCTTSLLHSITAVHCECLLWKLSRSLLAASTRQQQLGNYFRLSASVACSLPLFQEALEYSARVQSCSLIWRQNFMGCNLTMILIITSSTSDELSREICLCSMQIEVLPNSLGQQ